MRRSAIEDLKKWKESAERKPLVLRGARQVGKTWLMKEFGKSCYENFVYFNFDEEDELKSIFETNKNPRRIVELLHSISKRGTAVIMTTHNPAWIQEYPGIMLRCQDHLLSVFPAKDAAEKSESPAFFPESAATSEEAAGSNGAGQAETGA